MSSNKNLESIFNEVDSIANQMDDLRGRKALLLAQALRETQVSSNSSGVQQLIAMAMQNPDITLIDVLKKLQNVTRREEEKLRKR